MRIGAVLFDKDGTLVDFEASWGPASVAVIEAVAAGDAAIREALAGVSLIDLASARFHPDSPLIAQPTDELARDWAAVLGRVADAAFVTELDALFQQAVGGRLVPLGDPAAVTGRLAARGLCLGIATNDAEANARIQAEMLGIAAHLGFVAGHDSGHGAKPAPGQVLAFARHFGLPAASIAMVGDSPHDMEAARAAGALAVAVRSGPLAALAAPLADHVVDTIDDLPELFGA